MLQLLHALPIHHEIPIRVSVPIKYWEMSLTRFHLMIIVILQLLRTVIPIKMDYIQGKIPYLAYASND